MSKSPHLHTLRGRHCLVFEYLLRQGNTMRFLSHSVSRPVRFVGFAWLALTVLFLMKSLCGEENAPHLLGGVLYSFLLSVASVGMLLLERRLLQFLLNSIACSMVTCYTIFLLLFAVTGASPLLFQFAIVFKWVTVCLLVWIVVFSGFGWIGFFRPVTK